MIPQPDLFSRSLTLRKVRNKEFQDKQLMEQVESVQEAKHMVKITPILCKSV